MFCKNCGKEVSDQAAVCIHCGVSVTQTNKINSGGEKKMFCKNCGKEVSDQAAVCIHCGVAIQNSAVDPNAKSKIVAGLLGIFLGSFGIHRFYLGYTGIGVAQIIVSLVTCGVGGIWGFIEGIMILVGSMDTDASGVKLKD